MTIKNYLKERKSTRDFVDASLSADEISNVKNAISLVKNKFGWNDIIVDLVEDGNKVYESLKGKAGYAGVFIKAPAYISLTYSNRDKLNYLKGAFIIADLEEKLQDLGLGHCIISLEDNIIAEKKDLFGLAGENIDYLIGLGHPVTKGAFEHEVTSSRKKVEEIAFLDENFTQPATDKLRDLNMLDIFSSLKAAPSYKNNQPWRFLIKDSEITAYVENTEELKHSITDVGIIMYYLQEMAKTMGLKNNWDIVADLENTGDFIKLGRYKI